MGDIMTSDDAGLFRCTPHMVALVKFVENGTIRIPVMDPAYEERAYRRMWSVDKTHKIAAFILSTEKNKALKGETT